VVRQKARTGPIGVDNSEVVNLEVEGEFKKKSHHIFKLNNKTDDREEIENRGYVDEEGVYHGLDQDEKLFRQNEKLLTRLTHVAANDKGPKRSISRDW
jgi:hypothetical protein